MKNQFTMKLLANTANEAFARSTVTAFCVPLNPNMEQVNEIKTAVSEAITNSIVHAYDNRPNCFIELSVSIDGEKVVINIKDDGCGIADVSKAMEPFYTTKPDEERSGMGFTLMNSFMDELKVESCPQKGTSVTMVKIIRQEE